MNKIADKQAVGILDKLTQKHIQIALGIVWLLDGALQFQPWMFTKNFVTQILIPSAQGNPGWIATPTIKMAHFLEPHIVAWNGLFASIQVGIGIGILLGVLLSGKPILKLALAGSFIWSILVWWLSEGLGGVLTGSASPLTGAPGAVLLYIVIGIMVWPRTLGTEEMEFEPLRYGLISDRATRIIWACLWGFSGFLLLEPSNQQSGAIKSAISTAASGQPTWLHGLLISSANFFMDSGTWVNFLLALLMILIGFGVAFRYHPRLLLMASVVLSVVIWIFGEGFGGILTGQGTDPNSGLLWILLAGCLWVGLANTPLPLQSQRKQHLISSSKGHTGEISSSVESGQ
ncbi:MAG: hypothetical protein M1483_06315 [Actinobacteria bacterium]|nr:hypothetical protein [Actinomycetota bacterium]MCL6105219.1 hypothetical protein [Actinomycetota bacterium]